MSKLLLVGIYLCVFLLGVTASVKVYQAARDVERAHHLLIDRSLADLAILSRYRTEQVEHERLAYELYAAIDAERFNPLLQAQRARVETERVRLQPLIESPEQSARIDIHWGRITEQASALMDNMAADRIDWDAARTQLRQLNSARLGLFDLLDALDRQLRARALTAEAENRSKLWRMSTLVTAYTIVIFCISVWVGWATLRMIHSSARVRALAQFPARNPQPVLTLDRGAQVRYANRATREILQKALGTACSAQSIIPQSLERILTGDSEKNHHGRLEQALGASVLLYEWHWLDDQNVFHLYVKDVTIEHRAQRDLQRRAKTDEVTGLLNRRALLDAVQQQIDAGEPLNLAMIRVDRLHLLALSIGFDQIDRIVRQLADRMGAVIGRLLGPRVWFARIEAAVFAVAWRAQGSGFGTPDAPVTELLDRLPKTISTHRNLFHPSYRIGSTSLTGNKPANAEAMFRQADAALHATELRVDCAHLSYQPRIGRDQDMRLRLETRLRQTLRNGAEQLFITVQPQIDVINQRVVGGEVLVRWREPELGLVSPAQFIPVAEQSGLIVELGQWVANQTLDLLGHWQKSESLCGLKLAINICSVELSRPGFAENLLDQLRTRHVPAERMEIEVTERIVADGQSVAAVAALNRLRGAGVHVSIDDFGTGYSSLAYLSDLPISAIKIPRQFLAATPSNQQCLVPVFIQLARQLDLGCVAEGVETKGQMNALRKMGCELMQGFLFAPALRAGEFADWVAQFAASGATNAMPAAESAIDESACWRTLS